ncbi:putative RNA methyltransferase [Nocardia cerradoensis]|uniref:putative RNA methyltransferase n=2 Tax=Nocardia cerradoensis TaxID=85688 RepID=UPI0014447B60|nr:methyltransferase domain-containing protein [Nocardia cerradoensis]NKY45972.1 methyltransferase domain-containing protein [Nocardia cerradoensis]
MNGRDGETREATPGPVPRTPTVHATPLAAIAPALACPECRAGVVLRDRRLVCESGHSFDLAKQGYVSLLTGAATKMTGDTADMLDARARFQSAGHFGPIARATAEAVADGAPTGMILEIGAGTGYYLAAGLEAAPAAHGIALDVSKPAARRAARAHSRAASILADVWRGLPIRDHALDRVLCVFAPRNPAEVARVLRPGGTFVVVTPTPRHLGELIAPLGMVGVQTDKDERLIDALSSAFRQIRRVSVEYSMTLDHDAIANVVGMGPSAHHAAASREASIADLPEAMPVTASVTITTYRR